MQTNEEAYRTLQVNVTSQDKAFGDAKKRNSAAYYGPPFASRNYAIPRHPRDSSCSIIDASRGRRALRSSRWLMAKTIASNLLTGTGNEGRGFSV